MTRRSNRIIGCGALRVRTKKDDLLGTKLPRDLRTEIINAFLIHHSPGTPIAYMLANSPMAVKRRKGKAVRLPPFSGTQSRRRPNTQSGNYFTVCNAQTVQAIQAVQAVFSFLPPSLPPRILCGPQTSQRKVVLRWAGMWGSITCGAL
jgi:hypothetical protein